MDFNTREMIEALSLQNQNVIQPLFSTFFPVSNTHLADTLEIHVKKGKRRLAPFVAPRIGGKIVERDGFSTYLLKTPKIAPERAMTIDDISKRGFGEGIYSSKTPQERASDLIAKDLTELREYILNRKEWMARNILLTGKIDVKDPGESVDIQIDFNFTNKDTLIAGAKWNQSTSDPLENLRKYRQTIIKKSGKSPEVVIMGSQAYDDFKKHAKVKDAFNLINMNFGTIAPKIVDPALTFCGRLAELGLDIYVYDEWFVDDDDIEKAMLPENTIILLPLSVGSIEYGSVTQMEEGQHLTYEGDMIPKIYSDDKNDIKMIRLTSRPIPRPDDVDSWYVATVTD